jgi:nicotinamidase/pyrazinamidase
MSKALSPSADDALLVVDIQYDFCPGGSLAVQGGDEIVPLVNRIASGFPHVILTQDWHPPDHLSFASAHPGRKPFESVELPYGMQTLWPDHCVQGTHGAAFHAMLEVSRAELVLRKGFRREIDSYSAFFENDRRTPTGLAGYLRERSIRRVFLAGLALDFCVRWSAEDARRLGFDAIVIEDCCRAIDTAGSLVEAHAAFKHSGAVLISSAVVGRA